MLIQSMPSWHSFASNMIPKLYKKKEEKEMFVQLFENNICFNLEIIINSNFFKLPKKICLPHHIGFNLLTIIMEQIASRWLPSLLCIANAQDKIIILQRLSTPEEVCRRKQTSETCNLMPNCLCD